MRAKKGTKIHLSKDNIICLNCGTISLKYPNLNYKEPRKYCCHTCSVEHHKKIRPTGKLHYLWKGKNASYITQHQWINNNFGKANKCEHCNIKNSKRYHWANISGNYKRNISDYKQLCVSCHIKFNHINKYGDKCKRGHKRIPEEDRISLNGKWKECPQCRRDKYNGKTIHPSQYRTKTNIL